MVFAATPVRLRPIATIQAPDLAARPAEVAVRRVVVVVAPYIPSAWLAWRLGAF